MPALLLLVLSLSTNAHADEPLAQYTCDVQLREFALAAAPREFSARLEFAPGRTFSETKWTSREPHWISKNTEEDLALSGEARVELSSYGEARLVFAAEGGGGAESSSTFTMGAASFRSELKFQEGRGNAWTLSLSCIHK